MYYNLIQSEKNGAVQKRGNSMGQAQRSDRKNVPHGRAEEERADRSAGRRRKPGGTGKRAGSSRKSSLRKDISIISGGKSGSGAGSARSSRDGERAGGRGTDSEGLEGLEFWELSREDDDSRMMRLADREQVRSGQRRSRPRPQPDRRDTGSSYSDRRNAGNPRPVSSIKRRRARRRKVNLYRLAVFFVIGVCLILIYQTTGAIYRIVHQESVHKGRGIVEVISEKKYGKEDKLPEVTPPEFTEELLEVNDYSRPGTKLNKVKSVFVHYTANPGTSAAQNRSYFANLAETKERSASAHFIIGYEGELIQCIPLNEQAYAVATRNEDSVSIECCYLDEDGKFTQETYDTLVHTLAWLCGEYRLSSDDILRHYDCGGKKCPLYYVEHEDAWEQLLADVEAYKESI